ncbi:MAG TPA: hypothetical protein VNR37_03605 [Microbacteriaceae bacterium]|nr:hypothetical protein [Microbacteriaceae bacterium]
MKRRLLMIAAAVVAAPLIALGVALPASAATWHGGGLGCSGSSHVFVESITTGDVSHTVWISISNYAGYWWPGTGASEYHFYGSAKVLANDTIATAPSIGYAAAGCYV